MLARPLHLPLHPRRARLRSQSFQTGSQGPLAILAPYFDTVQVHVTYARLAPTQTRRAPTQAGRSPKPCYFPVHRLLTGRRTTASTIRREERRQFEISVHTSASQFVLPRCLANAGAGSLTLDFLTAAVNVTGHACYCLNHAVVRMSIFKTFNSVSHIISLKSTVRFMMKSIINLQRSPSSPREVGKRRSGAIYCDFVLRFSSALPNAAIAVFP